VLIDELIKTARQRTHSLWYTNEYNQIFGPKIWRTSERQAAIGRSSALC